MGFVAPKTEGRLNRISKALQFYYENHPNWMSNQDLKDYLSSIPELQEAAIGDSSGREDKSWYNSLYQIPGYYGLLEYETANSDRSRRRLSSYGYSFFQALVAEDEEQAFESFFSSVEHTIFGRNNQGAPSSDTDYEVPKIAIKAIYELEPIESVELKRLLSYCVINRMRYDEAKLQIINERAGANRLVIPPDDSEGYINDRKYILFLEELHIIYNSGTARSPIYNINSHFRTQYGSRILALDETNRAIVYNEEFADEIEEAEENSYRGARIISNEEERISIENRPPRAVASSTGIRYRTNPDIKRTALSYQNFTCQNGGSQHFCFIRKTTGESYVEGHHLIPMKAQSDFPNQNLDVARNIVALCPNCHKLLHHGTEEEVMAVLTNIFSTEERMALLDEFGFSSVEDLYNRYYR